MANLADKSGDAYSNLVPGNNTNSATFTMPGSVRLDVETVVATVDNTAGAATDATLIVADASGEVIATKRLDDVIPAGDTGGTATFSLRNADSGGGGGVGSGGTILLYDFSVTGAAKTSIDSGIDGTMAGAFRTDLTYLEVYITGRTDEAVFVSDVDIFFNNDTASTNYVRDFVASAIAGNPIQGQVTAGSTFTGVLAGNSAAASVPGLMRLFIPTYSSTVFFKICEFTAWSVDTVAGLTHYQIGLEAALWTNTAAITRIQVQPHTAGKKLMVGSRLSVWAR